MATSILHVHVQETEPCGPGEKAQGHAQSSDSLSSLFCKHTRKESTHKWSWKPSQTPPPIPPRQVQPRSLTSGPHLPGRAVCSAHPTKASSLRCDQGAAASSHSTRLLEGQSSRRAEFLLLGIPCFVCKMKTDILATLVFVKGFSISL